MNAAHFHLMVNHLPIVGVLIGVLTLIAAVLTKKSDVRLVAYGIFIFSALSSIAAFASGEEAEEIVEHIAGTSHELIHEHEEVAEAFYALVLVLGGLSIGGIIANIKQLKFARLVAWLVLGLSIATTIVGFQTGNTGGEIMHAEIREGASVEHDD